ncbi:MAG: alpha/beta fold hydrolase [Phycisphaerales bacterium]|nr:alpha/beta fold hydrolase [Phycisphaerales bacterium]MCI0677157.1 alpha/beta fold hydrolase [Phycisphaerales bacterium]
MRLFKNRIEAANELSQHLAFLKNDSPIVLGLANGGVPVAEVVARHLDAPLDVLLIEKLYAPNAPDQIVGAVDEHGRISMIHATARWHHLTSQQMVEPARQAFRQLQVRQARVRAILPELDVRGRTVIVIGQGVVSGAKMLGAIASLKDRGATRIVAAAPAGTSQATWQLHETADVVVIPHRPAKFKGIESFYEEFAEVSDDTIVRIVERWVGEHPQQQQGIKTISMKLAGTLGQSLISEVDLPPGMQRGSAPHATVIFAHGFESDGRSARSLTISRRLAKREIIGVRMNFTGHGRSEGKSEQATDAQMLADLHTVFGAVAGLAEVDAKRIGLVGSGTGGMIALHYAAQVPAVKALVIRGPVCGRETVAARQVKAPTLLIHAESDTALYDSVQTLDRELAAQHRLLRVPNSNRLFGDPISMELMVSATVDWLVDHLVVGTASQQANVEIQRGASAEPAASV